MYNEFVHNKKLNINSDLVVEVARLGLDGDKKRLIEYLKGLEAQSSDERKVTLNKKLSKLLNTYGSLEDRPSWQVSSFSSNSSTLSSNRKKLWFPKRLENRISLITKLLSDSSLPEDIRVKFNKILLYGKPGTGKTTIGLFIAQNLRYPIKYVKVSDVISYKFGETLKNLSDIFDSQGPSIVFIDEFDAFAKSRFDSNDVGELKRIVNSLIQTLDMLPSDKIVIVATNLIETIDPAIARRFPIKVPVGKLNKSERMDFINFLVKDAYTPIELSKSELDLLDSIFRESNIKTVDGIRSAIDSAIVNAHIEGKHIIKLEDIAAGMLNNGQIDSQMMKRLSTEKSDLYESLISLFSKQFTKTDVAEMLGLHRNSLLNYAKDL